MTLRNFRQKSYAPNTTLRGKIGPSLMKNRIINGRMDYMKSIQSGIKDILHKLLCYDYDYDYEMVLLGHTISTMYHGIIFKSCKKHNILQ